MQFARFTWAGGLTNWGWYSAQETALLAKEAEVAALFRRMEKFVRRKSDLLALFMDFMSLQLRRDVDTREIPAISVELDQIAARLTEYRLGLLDAKDADIPAAPQTFPNHQPDALVGEIRTYLAHRAAARERKVLERKVLDPLQGGFVIHRNPNTAAEFDRIIQMGSRVNYTVDTDGILSIGDTRTTKHSVVAVGRDVRAAGSAQMEIDPKAELYLSIKDAKERIALFEAEFQRTGKQEFRENADVQRENVEIWKEILGGEVAPVQVRQVIVLDFDSGHYAPREAWREATAAWEGAGYQVKWSRNARHV